MRAGPARRAPEELKTLVARIASLERAGRFAESLPLLERALAADRGNPVLHAKIGSALKATGRLEDAERRYRCALAIQPRFALGWSNLGNILKERGKLDESEAAYRRAIRLQPDFAEAYNNLGAALLQLGRPEDALDSFDRAIELAPGFAMAHRNRAKAALLLGRFERGWEDYLWRDGVDRAVTPRPSAPLAPHQSGRRICIHREQGLGDELFFLRFARPLKARGAWLAYRADPRLAPLLATAPFLDAILGPAESPGPVDSTVAVPDLPYLVAVGPEEAPPLPLVPDAARVARLRRRLAELGPPPYLGVTWRAGTEGGANLHKAVDLEPLARALASAAGTVVVAQRLPVAGDVESFARTLGRPAHDLSPLNDDLEDMLALMSLVDDYVAVSNTNVHLRAGVGKTCRILVPQPPEFRWTLAGEGSPWFPGFAVYRQSLSGDWGEPLGALAQDLLKRWSSGDASPA